MLVPLECDSCTQIPRQFRLLAACKRTARPQGWVAQCFQGDGLKRRFYKNCWLRWPKSGGKAIDVSRPLILW